MNPKLTHLAVVLAMLLATPTALLAEENQQYAVKPEQGEKAAAPEKGEWSRRSQRGSRPAAAVQSWRVRGHSAAAGGGARR